MRPARERAGSLLAVADPAAGQHPRHGSTKVRGATIRAPQLCPTTGDRARIGTIRRLRPARTAAVLNLLCRPVARGCDEFVR